MQLSKNETNQYGGLIMIEILRYKESEYEDIECSNCKSLLRVWGKEEKKEVPLNRELSDEEWVKMMAAQEWD